jgi:amino acid transporter
MSKNGKISLLSAILINLNTMMGAGVFLNAKSLGFLVGAFGFLGYILGEIIILPFVLSLAFLARLHPVEGGLYIYSKENIHPFAGFVSGWCYFVGKTTSATLLIHTFSKYFLQAYIPILQPVPTLFLDFIIISLLMLLNIAGLRIGGHAQKIFIASKIIPIAFVILAGFYYWQPYDVSFHMLNLENAIASIPIALYALMGFEMICSIGHLIENPKKNISRSIISASLIVVVLYTLFQFTLFRVLGPKIALEGNTFSIFVKTILPSYPLLATLVFALIQTSVIGGAFSMFIGNCWNIHAFARDNYLPFQKQLTALTRRGVPIGGLGIELILACIILLISNNRIPLQNVAVFGVSSSFLLSAISAFIASRKETPERFHPAIPGAAIVTCTYTLYLCMKKIMESGISFPFLAVLFSGIIVALWMQMRKPIQA